MKQENASRTGRTILTVIMSFVISGCTALFGESGPSGDAPVGTSASAVSAGRTDKAFSGRASGAGEGYLGGVVLADEPRAALVARDILERGGNAVDAAAALYFTLSVTYPGAAALGGGGICLAHNELAGTTESYDFLPRRAMAGGNAAIPGNVRGFSAMHAKLGRLSWGEVISPAETMAATGFNISRATAQQLQRHAETLRSDSELASAYLARSGAPLPEHATLTVPHLAASLALVRARGATAIYTSDAGRNFVAAARDAGAAFSENDLQNYRPRITQSQRADWGDNYIHLPDAQVGAGVLAGQLWQKVSSSGASQAAALSRETVRALGAEGAIPEEMGSTAFTVATGNGDAVACAVTMNGPFGTGKVARGTGVLLAKTPEASVEGLAGAFLSPVLVTNRHTNNLFFAGAAAGGPDGPAAIQKVLSETLVSGRAPLSDALSNAHAQQGTTVNALVCPQGLPRGANECEFGVDPKGAGLGLEAISSGS